MKKSAPWICSILIALVISAFLHMADADVNGFQGLWTLNVLLSVFVFSIPFFIGMALSLLIIQKWGKLAGLGSLVVFSIVLGALIFLAGSTAVTFQEKMISFCGASGCLLIMFSLGILIPKILLEKIRT